MVIVFEDCFIFEVLCDVGFVISSFCESGMCGICKICLLEGEVDYCDMVLMEEEKGS